MLDILEKLLHPVVRRLLRNIGIMPSTDPMLECINIEVKVLLGR